jgi:hypothetical protein
MKLSSAKFSLTKLRLGYLAILTGTLLLQGCGGSGLAGGDNKDIDTMRPVAGTEDLSARPRPPENAVVITTDEHLIYDALKQPIFLRGINHLYAANPSTRIAGIPAIKLAGSNAIRLQLDENTTEIQFEGAMAKIVESGMVAVVTLTAPGNKLTCTEDSAYLLNAVDTLWFKKFLPILVQDRFQSHLMLNIANGWGAMDIFNQDSLGYQEYIDTYKSLIRKFRTAGFKFPLVIDAPSCGQDFNVFLNGRSRELMASDSAKNLVFGVHAYGLKWNSSEKIINAATQLYNEKVPFIVTDLMGSGVADGDDIAVDHVDVMKKSAGDIALAFDLPWSTTADTAAYSMTLDTPLDLRSGAVLSTSVFLDKIYSEYVRNSSGNFIPTGKIGFAIYVKDVNGNTLRAGTTVGKDLRNNQWGKISFSLPATKGDINPANYLNGATDIDLSKIQKIGIQVLANGKPADLKADIKFDDLTIFPGAPAPTLAVESTFNNGAGGWNRPDWSPGKVVFADGYAKLSMSSGDWGLVLESPGWQSQEVLPKINFKQTVFVDLKVFVPASYAGQTPAFTVNGQFGSGWNIEPVSGASIVGELKYNDWNTYRAVLKWSDSYDVSVPQNIAVRLSGVVNVEPLLVDTITITQQEGQRMKTITALQYESKFTKTVETYAANWGTKALVEQVDGELHITPEWKNDAGAANDDVVVLKADINSINDIDVSGPVTYKVRIFVPASYAGSSLDFEVFTQDNNWGQDTQFPGRHLTIADFKPGEWTSFVFNTDTFAPGFARTQKLRHFGFRWKGVNFDKGVVKIDDVQLYGNKQVVDALPILNVDFSLQSQHDAFKFDFASGSFTASSLATAKFADWSVIPFGWLASSWKGNTGANAVLDISKAEDIVDLTARGEEIVNGVLGIKATSRPANFYQAPKVN